jgi:hypothetical protein
MLWIRLIETSCFFDLLDDGNFRRKNRKRIEAEVRSAKWRGRLHEPGATKMRRYKAQASPPTCTKAVNIDPAKLMMHHMRSFKSVKTRYASSLSYF